jgi:hypothetical protein
LSTPEEKTDVGLYCVLFWGAGKFAAPTIVSTTIIDCLFDPPAPLSLLGKNVLEAASNAILYTALHALQNTFLKNLANDYNHWAKDSAYRMSRQE